MNLLLTQPDTLRANLWVHRMARDFTKFPANPKYFELSWLEKAFLNKFPGYTALYLEFKKEELNKWGANFNEAFQKHSLFLFVADNFADEDIAEF